VNAPVIELRSVVKHFAGPEVVRAVDGVSLSIAAGEVVALYGPSGSGKTTLLLLAGGYLTPDRGDVLLDGVDVGKLSLRERALHQRRSIGLVEQRFHLTRGATALDNAAVKLLADRVSLNEARERVAPWLDRVGLGDRMTHTPERLSGGEAQRVALARALANEPRLILADEPTGALDRVRGAEILNLIASIAREWSAAVLIVTHDPDAARVADRVHSLTDGRLHSGHGPTELAVTDPASWSHLR
jgi:ABC-type lipoprotein export system ATPase subunit